MVSSVVVPGVPGPVDIHKSLQKNGSQCYKSEKISNNVSTDLELVFSQNIFVVYFVSTCYMIVSLKVYYIISAVQHRFLRVIK